MMRQTDNSFSKRSALLNRWVTELKSCRIFSRKENADGVDFRLAKI